MKITPLDIYQKEFRRKALNGLDPQDVEDFLFQVAEAVEALLNENAALKRQSNRGDGAANSADETERPASELRATSAEELQRARAEAERVRSEAKAEASALVDNARIEAERILRAGQSRAESTGANQRQLQDTRRLAEQYQSLLVRHLSHVTQLLGENESSAEKPVEPETEVSRLGTE